MIYLNSIDEQQLATIDEQKLPTIVGGDGIKGMTLFEKTGNITYVSYPDEKHVADRINDFQNGMYQSVIVSDEWGYTTGWTRP